MTQNEPTLEEEASDAFVQRLQGEWTAEDQAALEARLEQDPAYAEAYRRVAESWAALDTHAEVPEVMGYREEALSYARRASARRWLKSNPHARSRWRAAAALVGAALTLAVAWQLSPYGYRPGQYITGIGEQRIVELEDHTRIALDAATRLQVRYSDDARIVQLKEGQAQFSVAKDPARPFKVQVGDHTIVALGTVFTVEYIDRNVHVAMMEGRVAVYPPSSRNLTSSASPSDGESGQRSGEAPSERMSSERADKGSRSLATSPAPSNGEGSGVRNRKRLEVRGGLAGEAEAMRLASAIELAAGEELRVSRNGQATVIPKADLEAATAWREGKVIFRGETLEQAVRRLNRYSQVRIEIEDAALAAERISGVFLAGDTQGFLSAIQRYLPVEVHQTDSMAIRLSTNPGSVMAPAPTTN